MCGFRMPIGKKAAGAVRVQLSYEWHEGCMSRVRFSYDWHEGCMSRVRLLYDCHEGRRSRVRLLYDWHEGPQEPCATVVRLVLGPHQPCPVTAIAVSCIHNYAHGSKLQASVYDVRKYGARKRGLEYLNQEEKGKKRYTIHRYHSFATV